MKVSTTYAAVLFAALSAVGVSGEPGQHAVAPAEYHAQPASQPAYALGKDHRGKDNQPQHAHEANLPVATPVAVPYHGPEHGGYEIKKVPHTEPALYKPSAQHGGSGYGPKPEIAPQHNGGENKGPEFHVLPINPGYQAPSHAGGKNHGHGYNGGVTHGPDHGFKGDIGHGNSHAPAHHEGAGHGQPGGYSHAAAPEHHNVPKHAPASGLGYEQGPRGGHKGSEGYVPAPHHQKGAKYGDAQGPAHGHSGNGYQHGAAPVHQGGYGGSAPTHIDREPIHAPHGTPVHTPIHTPQH